MESNVPGLSKVKYCLKKILMLLLNASFDAYPTLCHLIYLRTYTRLVCVTPMFANKTFVDMKTE